MTVRPVAAEVEKTSWTSRKLFANVYISAPLPVVWSCLTDYDGLGNFIPSLMENQCLKRKPNGAVLRQVGAQDVAMGVKFSAACTLDCTEYLEGVPQELVAPNGSQEDARLPVPRSTAQGVPYQDISFEQIDGDFQEFRGIWRMQHRRDGTLLSYSLFVRPKAWLPVGLIQDRIEKEVVRNLDAVRHHAERLHNSSSSSSGSMSS